MGASTAAAGPGIGPLLVVEENADLVARARNEGMVAMHGNAFDPEVLAACNLAGARILLLAVPDAFEGGQIVEQARKLNPSLTIVARAHSEEEIEHLRKHGATHFVMGVHEIAKAMLGMVGELPR